MNFSSVNNSTHITTFDSTVAGAPTCFIKYNSVTGIMNMEYHSIGAFNAASGHYYETNIYLQSH